jgi:hypothetical protein
LASLVGASIAVSLIIWFFYSKDKSNMKTKLSKLGVPDKQIEKVKKIIEDISLPKELTQLYDSSKYKITQMQVSSKGGQVFMVGKDLVYKCCNSPNVCFEEASYMIKSAEAEVFPKVHSTNVTYSPMCTHDGYVMDFFSGGSLHFHMENKDCPIDKLAADLFNLYTKLEKNGISHNDFHSNNIIYKTTNHDQFGAIDPIVHKSGHTVPDKMKVRNLMLSMKFGDFFNFLTIINYNLDFKIDDEHTIEITDSMNIIKYILIHIACVLIGAKQCCFKENLTLIATIQEMNKKMAEQFQFLQATVWSIVRQHTYFKKQQHVTCISIIQYFIKCDDMLDLIFIINFPNYKTISLKECIIDAPLLSKLVEMYTSFSTLFETIHNIRLARFIERNKAIKKTLKKHATDSDKRI